MTPQAPTEAGMSSQGAPRPGPDSADIEQSSPALAAELATCHHVVSQCVRHTCGGLSAFSDFSELNVGRLLFLFDTREGASTPFFQPRRS